MMINYYREKNSCFSFFDCKCLILLSGDGCSTLNWSFMLRVLKKEAGCDSTLWFALFYLSSVVITSVKRWKEKREKKAANTRQCRLSSCYVKSCFYSFRYDYRDSWDKFVALHLLKDCVKWLQIFSSKHMVTQVIAYMYF